MTMLLTLARRRSIKDIQFRSTVVWWLLFVPAFSASLLSHLVTVAQAQGIPATGDEFVGPLAGWTNAKTTFGAKGDGVTDDTAALQKALNAIGRGGVNPVLWVPAGTYLISGTLTVSNVESVSIIGEDPTTTIIKWTGPSGGTLLHVSGIDYSRISRLTFEGAGAAGTIIDQSNTSSGYFDTGNEYSDDFFQNASIGIQCGGNGANGCSEMSVLRDQFIHLSTIGVIVKNFNALDIWVRYSIFDHVAVGVGDCTWYTGLSGAGNFHVYNSIFRYSSIQDICIGNTSSFSLRNNYSIGANYFIGASNTNNPAPTVVQGNVIIDPANTIYWGNLGPLVLLDNTIRSTAATTGPIVRSGAWGPSDMVAVGNTVTVPNAFANTSGGRLTEIGTAVVSASSIKATEPTLPGVEPNLKRTVAEVPPGATAGQIQQAINTVMAHYNGQRAVVHIPAGNYTLTQTITIPANSDLQLVGDGGRGSSPTRTVLSWGGSGAGPVLSIQGPSKATLRDLYVQGNGKVDAIGVSNIDQAGSRVYMFGTYADGGSNSNVFYDSLDYAAALMFDAGVGSELGGSDFRVVGGPLAAAGSPQGGKLVVYSGGGGGDASYASNIDVSHGGTFLLRDFWFDGEPSKPYSPYANVSQGTVTFDGDHIWMNQTDYPATPPTFNISNLNGTVAILATDYGNAAVISGSGAQAKVAAIGVVRDQPAPSNSYFINNGSPPATAGLLDSQQWATAAQGAACGCATVPTPNSGVTSDTFVQAMIAQARAEQAPMLTALPAGTSDVRLFRVSANLGINSIHLSGGGSAPPPPPSPPATPLVVTVLYPPNGSPISDVTYIRGAVTGNAGTTSMQVAVDGQNLCAGNGTSILCKWNINGSTVSKGSHTIKISAQDAAGDVGSASVNVTKY